jgi:hypothetical protein
MRLHPTRRRHGIVLIALTLLASCSGLESEETGEGDGSCALLARLDGRSYDAWGGVSLIPTYGDSLGSAVIPPCGNEREFRIEAFRIVGVKPEIAFASPQYEESVFIAKGVSPLPSELERLRQEPKCIAKGGPVRLQGPWLGIIGTDGKTEVDLVPPYNLSMRVDAASNPRFERAFLTIHVGTELGRPLTREDLRSSLWEGGDLAVTAKCIDGEFWAEQVTASPPS